MDVDPTIVWLSCFRFIVWHTSLSIDCYFLLLNRVLFLTGIYVCVRTKFGDKRQPLSALHAPSVEIFLRIMQPDFAADWKRLGALAFRRQEKIGDVFKRICRTLKTRENHPDIYWLRLVKNWMLVPFTLWPIDFAGVARHACKRVQLGKRLERGIVFSLEQLRALPSEKVQAAISDYEMHVQKGEYEPLIRARTKYSSQERDLLSNRKLKSEWALLKGIFNVEKFRDRKGIIRRRLAQERNFRTNWEFRRNTNRDQFQMAFDAFCHRWNLYGIEGDKPLLLKLSVNPTAHGLMIVVPSYWSLDSKRDLNWPEINKLHKTRGALRQGPKMSEGRLERHQQAQKAYDAAQQAKRRGLRGQKRLDFIANKTSLPPSTESRILRRLVREGRQY